MGSSDIDLECNVVVIGGGTLSIVVGLEFVLILHVTTMATHYKYRLPLSLFVNIKQYAVTHIATINIVKNLVNEFFSYASINHCIALSTTSS